MENVDVWFQDEARVGQRGTLTGTWTEKGTRPRMTRQQQFEYAYIFGDFYPCPDEAVGVVLPYANTKVMLKHLQAVSQAVPNTISRK